MRELFGNRYRVDTTRLQGYDYGRNGLYFITICTKGRRPFFGNILYGKLVASYIGHIAIECWSAIPRHFAFVALDAVVLMPDHLHAILFLLGDDPPKNAREYFFGSADHCDASQPNQTAKGNRFGPQRGNLAAVIRGYKSAVTSQAKKEGLAFGWQSRYHDRIIRSPEELAATRNYILQNPTRPSNYRP